MYETIKDPFFGNKRWYYFGGGGGGLPSTKPTRIVPTRVDPEVAVAKQNLREKMMRAQGRAASREMSPGFLSDNKTGLKDTLA